MKTKLGEGMFAVRTFKRGQRLVFALGRSEVAWVLTSAARVPATEKCELKLGVGADDYPLVARLTATPWPDGGRLMTPCQEIGIAAVRWNERWKWFGVLHAGVDRLGACFTGHQIRSGVPPEQRTHHFHIAGWKAVGDQRVQADLGALDAAIDRALSSRSWVPLAGMSAIIEGEHSQREVLPAWSVPMEHLVAIGLLELLQRYNWQEAEVGPMDGLAEVMTDFSVFKQEAGTMSGRTPAPTYEFWPTVGRVAATPFTATANAVAWTTVVVTAPIWGPILLYPYLR